MLVGWDKRNSRTLGISSKIREVLDKLGQLVTPRVSESEGETRLTHDDDDGYMGFILGFPLPSIHQKFFMENNIMCCLPCVVEVMGQTAASVPPGSTLFWQLDFPLSLTPGPWPTNLASTKAARCRGCEQGSQKHGSGVTKTRVQVLVFPVSDFRTMAY